LLCISSPFSPYVVSVIGTQSSWIITLIQHRIIIIIIHVWRNSRYFPFCSTLHWLLVHPLYIWATESDWNVRSSSLFVTGYWTGHEILSRAIEPRPPCRKAYRAGVWITLYDERPFLILCSPLILLLLVLVVK
jgi:hypothetical protein